MLKRLNFIKSSLEAHSPRGTTAQLRLKAQQKREERVVEIWKREFEMPSVQEILSQHLKNKPEVNIVLEDQQDEYDSRNNSNIKQARSQQVKYHSVTRNMDPLRQQNSIELSKRDPHLSTAFETSASQVKTSNDSNIMQLKHKLNNTFYLQAQGKMNLSMTMSDDN